MLLKDVLVYFLKLQDKIISDSNDKKNFGLHIHTPEKMS